MITFNGNAHSMQLKIDFMLINAFFHLDLWASLSLPGYITYHDNYSTYANQTQLKIHFLNDSPMNANCADTKLFSCTRCQRKYKFRKTLNRHMNHECGKDKIHTCTACPYRTYRNDRLLSHIRIVHPSIAPSPKRGKMLKIENVKSLATRFY